MVFNALNTATGDFVAIKRMEMDCVKLDAGSSIKARRLLYRVGGDEGGGGRRGWSAKSRAFAFYGSCIASGQPRV